MSQLHPYIAAKLKDFDTSDSSEVHAMTECIRDGLDGLPIEDQIEMYQGMVSQFADCAKALAKKPKKAEIALVPCEFCGEQTLLSTAHLHTGGYVGDDCCWTEQLRSTE